MVVSQALANVQLFGEEGEDSERGQGEETDERAMTTPRQVEQVEDGSESKECDGRFDGYYDYYNEGDVDDCLFLVCCKHSWESHARGTCWGSLFAK